MCFLNRYGLVLFFWGGGGAGTTNVYCHTAEKKKSRLHYFLHSFVSMRNDLVDRMPLPYSPFQVFFCQNRKFDDHFTLLLCGVWHENVSLISACRTCDTIIVLCAINHVSLLQPSPN